MMFDGKGKKARRGKKFVPVPESVGDHCEEQRDKESAPVHVDSKGNIKVSFGQCQPFGGQVVSASHLVVKWSVPATSWSSGQYQPASASGQGRQGILSKATLLCASSHAKGEGNIKHDTP